MGSLHAASLLIRQLEAVMDNRSGYAALSIQPAHGKLNTVIRLTL